MSRYAPEWQDICALNDLSPDCGVCALLDNKQVAIFYLSNGDLYAISNHDPLGKANVMSRGLIADINGIATVSSPLYRHHYRLDSGQCLQDDSICVPTYPVRAVDGRVQLQH
ncbi:nitrite reductase small subunit NirD [Ferrimonas aestuarii]|uniref:Nitrite reductase small subunit NirD n=1 Tax=Ferrimonas aestuarii TaxID=2569539 RepID=A0A4U1BJS0_9GAMM|nr:nitrite reductase small subunit NirD [Ferrimonas aestuarii]TKB51801.1 nitrite reductase small subunit NirD [Ferrimonas aestuarii]